MSGGARRLDDGGGLSCMAGLMLSGTSASPQLHDYTCDGNKFSEYVFNTDCARTAGQAAAVPPGMSVSTTDADVGRRGGHEASVRAEDTRRRSSQPDLGDSWSAQRTRGVTAVANSVPGGLTCAHVQSGTSVTAATAFSLPRNLPQCDEHHITLRLSFPPRAHP
jgi:hypothetical protein